MTIKTLIPSVINKNHVSSLEKYYACHDRPSSHDHRPSHPYNVGTEQVGFSPTRQALHAPSAKRREVLGGSHEG